jgi:hypothetical protein
MTKEEFDIECKKRGFRVQTYYFDKYVAPIHIKYPLDENFYNVTKFLTNDDPTICKVLRYMVLCDDIKDRFWLNKIGQIMGKKMYNALQERKK